MNAFPQRLRRLLKKSRCERFVSWHDFSRADKSFIFVIPSGLQLARLTLARKIAAITLHVWKKGEAFDAEYLKSQAA